MSSTLQSSSLPPTPPGADEGSVVVPEDVVEVANIVELSPVLTLLIGVGIDVGRAVIEPSMTPPREKKETMADSIKDPMLMGTVVKPNDSVALCVVFGPPDGKEVTIVELGTEESGNEDLSCPLVAVICTESDCLVTAPGVVTIVIGEGTTGPFVNRLLILDIEGEVPEYVRGKSETVSCREAEGAAVETTAGAVGLLGGILGGFEKPSPVVVIDSDGKCEASLIKPVGAVDKNETIPVDALVVPATVLVEVANVRTEPVTPLLLTEGRVSVDIKGKSVLVLGFTPIEGEDRVTVDIDGCLVMLA
ncbi:hypothetical protein V8F20_010162 [Naviculisporaceae sp. PSN 640]